MKKLNCLIVDDEELARKLIQNHLGKVNFLELTGMAKNATEAFEILRENDIDVIFLDIQMPDVSGIDFAKMVTPDTQIIFTTAYSEFALDGFELNAVDYLLKPITFERFLKAVNKLQDGSRIQSEKDTIIIKSGYDLHKVRLANIRYVESSSEYVIFYTDTRKIMSYQTLKSLEDILPEDQFMRVHRSYIVNIEKVNTLKGKDLLIEQTKIPVSASYYESVKERIF